MLEMRMKIKKVNEKATVPTYGSLDAAGADLYACLDKEKVTIQPGEVYFCKTGIAIEITKGYAGLIYARSSLACKRGLAPANKVGVVDADYRGEIMVALRNDSLIEQEIEHGERIAQIIFTPYLKADFELVDELEDTTRGVGGFGSTGTK